MPPNTSPFEIFLVTTPGLEDAMSAEAVEAGFVVTGRTVGGVTLSGGWPDVWRANLELRGAGKVLARIASFPSVHFAQLDKRARNIPWTDYLRNDQPVRVTASCRKSKIYHSGAAAERIAAAISAEGIPVREDAEAGIMARIENNIATISIDTSGELLHRRGSKQAMAKAPMRETIAALILRHCGFSGTEPVVDPMCGSGTFIIEAAEMALALPPGRNRSFAFEKLAGFDAEAWDTMRRAMPSRTSQLRFHGSDRDAGAIKAAQANAERTGVSHVTSFARVPISELTAPDGPPGLVIMNPPYGSRIGEAARLRDLYASIGTVMRDRFKGWRIGLITSNEALARATGLTLRKSAPLMHGGLRVHVYTATPSSL